MLHWTPPTIKLALLTLDLFSFIRHHCICPSFLWKIMNDLRTQGFGQQCYIQRQNDEAVGCVQDTIWSNCHAHAHAHAHTWISGWIHAEYLTGLIFLIIMLTKTLVLQFGLICCTQTKVTFVYFTDKTVTVKRKKINMAFSTMFCLLINDFSIPSSQKGTYIVTLVICKYVKR